MKGRTYRYFEGAPEYPFGYGLSYTRFAYSGLRVGSSQLAAGTPRRVSVQVQNTGGASGDEVVQLYVSTPDRPEAPLRSLKGFARVHLGRGERRTVNFQLDPRDLAFADKDGVMRIASGTYSVWVGGGQSGTGAPGRAASFRMNGNLALQP